MERLTWSLFEEPYWLEAVAPNQWSTVEVAENGVVVGRLPFRLRRQSGLTRIGAPPLTPWLGPWIRSRGGKYLNELSLQHQTLVALIEQLPKADEIRIACAPEFTNLMAMYWHGYDLKLRYTYRLALDSGVDCLWQGLRENIRRETRKAEKQLVVSTESSLSEFFGVVEKTFARQNQSRRELLPVLERIDDVMGKRGQRCFYFARDAAERLHAAIYVVFDDRCSFYLMGGGDPELRSSGAHSLLMWHAIKDGVGRSTVFDFEGSMIEPIEKFFRAFNARQTPRYLAERHSQLGRLAGVVNSSLGAMRGRSR